MLSASNRVARPRRAPSGAQLALVARYQLLTLLVMVAVARAIRPAAVWSVVEGGGLVALNLQLSRAMLPVLAALRARGGSPGRQMAWVGAASLVKLCLQLAAAAVLLIHWPPASTPFLVGLSSFVGGGLGAAAHGIVGALWGNPTAARRGAG